MNDWRRDDEMLIVPISALAEYRFCPRRCGLMFLEGEWEDNVYTIEGRELHERVDLPGIEERDGVRIERALPIFSDRLGLSGRADVVEFIREADGRERPYPVEYKRGKLRRYEEIHVQVCAQAMCLEEMFGIEVPVGAVYFGHSRRRREIPLTPELRAVVERTVVEVRTLLLAGITPRARLDRRCNGCSMRSVCMPEVTGIDDASARYVDALRNLSQE